MTIKTLDAADVYDIYLDTDSEADTVTFVPKDGSPRSVVVVAEEVGRAEDSSGFGIKSTLDVFCGRDATHAKGGIDNPKPGDAILFGTDLDPLQEQYFYTGNVIEKIDSYAWVLEFQRIEIVQVGGNARMQ